MSTTVTTQPVLPTSHSEKAIEYAPPPGPPPSHAPQPQMAPALLPTDSLIPLEHLAAVGWFPLPIHSDTPEYTTLRESYSNLFNLSSAFFALQDDHPAKTSRPASPTKSWHTEDGWSKVQGEKQLLSVRHAKHAPTEGDLRAAVEDVWKVSAPILITIMRDIARSLGLDEGAFDPMIVPCASVPAADSGEDASPTLMRMFRYDRPTDSSAKIVSEAHRDLGLITLVVGHSPGLEVFYPPNPPHSRYGNWLPLEQKQLEELASLDVPEPRLTATIMTGQCLTHLTNGRYRPGLHRVLVHPPSSTDKDPYRYSIVYALRPISAVPLSSSAFSSPIIDFKDRKATGYELDGKTAGGVMGEIAGRLFNVNIDKDAREKQKQKLKEGKVLPRAFVPGGKEDEAGRE